MDQCCVSVQWPLCTVPHRRRNPPPTGTQGAAMTIWAPAGCALTPVWVAGRGYETQGKRHPQRSCSCWLLLWERQGVHGLWGKAGPQSLCCKPPLESGRCGGERPSVIPAAPTALTLCAAEGVALAPGTWGGTPEPHCSSHWLVTPKSSQRLTRIRTVAEKRCRGPWKPLSTPMYVETLK